MYSQMDSSTEESSPETLVSVREQKQKLECDQCGKLYASKPSLWQHKQTHKSEGDYACVICHKKFKVKAYLSKHMNVHRDAQFECGVCHQKFKNSWYRNQHEKSHQTPGKYECHICNKKFNIPNILYTHMHVHGERAFKCDFCDKGFKTPAHLKRHRLIHTRIKEYHYCHICNRKFLSEETLATHLERKSILECDKCDAKFHGKEIFKQHLRKHIPEPTFDFKCKICGIKAMSQEIIDTHMSYEHIEAYMRILKEKNGVMVSFDY